jgi:hypothetical protein
MHRQAISVLLATLLGVLAGCGGGKAPASSAAQGAPPASAAARKATPALPPDPRLVSKENCDQLYNIAKSFSAMLDTGDSGSLRKTTALLKVFATRAPSDIRPDFRVLANAYEKIFAVIDATGTNGDMVANLKKLSGQIDVMKVSQASTHMQLWAAKNCANYSLDSLRP